VEIPEQEILNVADYYCVDSFIWRLCGGYHGYRRGHYGRGGFGIIGIIVLILIVFLIFGGGLGHGIYYR
jgi:hypothetical protein